MKNKLLIIPLMMSFHTASYAEIQISISNPNGILLSTGNSIVSIPTNHESLSVSTRNQNIFIDKNISKVRTDSGNTNYIYVDKNSHIVNSTIGERVYTNRQMTKEEKNLFYQKKIHRYEEKIERYYNKISQYKEKIQHKPKYKYRYQGKIEAYLQKIENYNFKIKELRQNIH